MRGYHLQRIEPKSINQDRTSSNQVTQAKQWERISQSRETQRGQQESQEDEEQLHFGFRIEHSKVYV